MGVSIGSGASANVIGGLAPEARNLISGNRNSGITITDAGTTGNVVEGNYIGTDNDGTGIASPTLTGVSIGSGASGKRDRRDDGRRRQRHLRQPPLRHLARRHRHDGQRGGGQLHRHRQERHRRPPQHRGRGDRARRVGRTSIGGTVAGARNLISGNNLTGVLITGAGTTGNRVEGNFIGTNQDGTASLPNRIGMSIGSGASGNVIGGTAAGAGNIISGNSGSNPGDGAGIKISDADRRATAWRATRSARPRMAPPLWATGRAGVSIEGNGNFVGGTAGGAGNTIAFNSGAGVASFGSGNAMEHNAIFSNAALGIDLGGDGVTPNDPGDFDDGADQLQNFPVITSAFSSGNTTVIAGTLESTCGQYLHHRVLRQQRRRPDRFRPGPRVPGLCRGNDRKQRQASFTVTLPIAIPADALLTATATDAGNNTSEFSRAAVQSVNIVLPSISIDNVTVTEGDSGTVNATFMVRLIGGHRPDGDGRLCHRRRDGHGSGRLHRRSDDDTHV